MLALYLSFLSFAQEPADETKETSASETASSSESNEPPKKTKDKRATSETNETQEQSSAEHSNSPQTVFPVIFSGLEPQMALLRAAAASKKDISTLKPTTMIDLAAKKKMIVRLKEGKEDWLFGTASSCSSYPMSISNLKMLTQTADNDIMYDEIQKAEKRLLSASNSLVCLQDQIDADVVQRLYFLKGVLEQIKEDNDASAKAFSLAVRFKPDLEFGDDHSEEAEVIFNEAKRSLSKAKEIPMSYIPFSPKTTIWVNGVPLLEGAEHFLYEGENIIQVVSEQTIQTYGVELDSKITEVQLVIPSAIPLESSTWVSDEQKRTELDFLINQIGEPQTELFVHNSGEIWTTTIGTSNWQQLNVPKNVGPKADPRELTGKILFWSGVATVVVAGSYTGVNFLNGVNSVNTAGSTQDFSVYDRSQSDYVDAKAKYNIGWTITLGGAAVGGLGYWMAF
ncbi:MAG: hypothetical protein VX278_11005 [Myxococcota bacterium]|nr:hypothetical protein [Myxococcota bacterium]